MRSQACLATPSPVPVEKKWNLVDGFTRKTFTAMIEGVRESAIEAGITDPEAFDAGVRDLHRTTGGGRRLLLHVLQGGGREEATHLTMASSRIASLAAQATHVERLL